MRPPRPLRSRAGPALAAVADRFGEAVTEGRGRGALAVRPHGRWVADLRGGAANPAPGAPWRERTLACAFSVTKGVLAILAQRLVADGRLDPAAPVARLWPEFADGGKAAVTVAEVLTHRAGLPWVAGPVTPGDLYHPGRMAALLAAAPPVVPRGGAPVYHSMTFGHLPGEVPCRAAGVRPLGRPVARELAGPLGADLHLCLGPAEEARRARPVQEDPGGPFRGLAGAPGGAFARSMAFFDTGADCNGPRWRRAGIGSGSGHGTARAIAQIFAQVIEPGGLLPSERQEALTAELVRGDGPDPVLGVPCRFSEGLELSTPPGSDFGPSPRPAGYWGAGGATGFADPEAGLAFADVTGEMAAGFGSSPRAHGYVAALYACL
jgi:CubicO group peptidase (beta-lactamase class C family)